MENTFNWEILFCDGLGECIADVGKSGHGCCDKETRQLLDIKWINNININGFIPDERLKENIIKEIDECDLSEYIPDVEMVMAYKNGDYQLLQVRGNFGDLIGLHNNINNKFIYCAVVGAHPEFATNEVFYCNSDGSSCDIGGSNLYEICFNLIYYLEQMCDDYDLSPPGERKQQHFKLLIILKFFGVH